MKRLLLLLSVCYTLGSVAQESYPLQAIERTSFYAEPVDPPTETALLSGNIAARDGGGNTVGLTTGELSVSGTGAAVYTVPIAVPQGIKGVAPTLALTYNSQSGNGIAGYGWHLAGLSVISRVGSTMYHNDKITEVNLTETDQFALDGQRLMLKEGVYGKAGATYQTEVFSDLKIKQLSEGATMGFEVLYPDGSKAYYGKENNSQSPMEYAISSWENAQGVSIEYYYTIENNFLRIKHIEYGNNAKIEFNYDDRTRPEVAYVGGMEFINGKILSTINVTDNNIPYRSYILSYNTNGLQYNRLTSVQEKVGGESRLPIEFKYWDTAKNREDLTNFSLTSSKSTLYFNVNLQNSVTVPLDIDGDNYTDFIIYPTVGEKAYKELFIFDNLKKETPSFTKAIIPEGFKDIFPAKILGGTGNILRGQGIVLYSVQDEGVTFKVCAKGSMLYEQYERKFNFTSYPDERGYYQTILDNRGTSNPIPEMKYSVNKWVDFISGDFDGNGLTDIIGIEHPFMYEKCHIMKRECVCDRRDTENRVFFIDLDKRKERDYIKIIGRLNNSLRFDNVFLSMDVTGNGKDDIVHIVDGCLSVYEIDNNYQLQLLYEYHNSSINTKKRVPIAGDYNGDGKKDFLIPIGDYTTHYILLVNTGKELLPLEQEFPFIYKEPETEIKVTKANNSFWGNFLNIRYQVYHYGRLIPIDINNDGKTDIISTYASIVPDKYKEDNRSGAFVAFVNSSQNDNSVSFISGKRIELSSKGVIPHTIFSSPDERDRQMNISFYADNKLETFTLKQNNKEDMLLRQVDLGGIQQNITYRPMSIDYSYEHFRDELFTYDANTSNIVYPYTPLENVSQIRLVGKIERLVGGIPKVQRIFNYYNGISHAEGLGFLGFQAMGNTNWYDPEKRKEQLLYTHKIISPYLRGAVLDEYSIENNTYGLNNEPVRVRSYFQHTTYQYTDALSPNKVFKLQLTQQTTEDRLSGLTTTNNFSYDADGNLTEQRTQTDGYSQNTRVSYLPKSESPYFSGLPQQKETTTTLAGDSFSTAETFAYEKGLLTTHKTKGNGTGWRTTSYGYDEYGNVTEQTATAEDGQQRTERYTYDPSHRFVTTHTDHEGQVTKFSYNNRGLLESETTPLGQSTLYTYDLWGRPTQTTNFLGKKTTMRYSFDGGIFKTITENEEGVYSAESYNTLGWLLEKESNDAFNNHYAVSYEYDGIGQQVAVSTPHPTRGASQKVKRTEYDVYGRPTTITSPEGKVTRFTYDKLKTTADDGQQQVISTHDAQGNIIEHQDTGGTVRYTYFANGSLKTADYGGAIQKITQDGWGRKTSLTDPSAGRYTYQYDTWGNLTEETTPKGKTTFNYAQGTDRLTEKHITGDYTDMHIRYTYNADKLLTQIDNQNKDGNNDSYRYEYNGLKQLVQTTETNPQAVFTKNYTYDAFGRVQQETTTAQTAGKRVSSAVQYRYENGELIEMKTPSGATLWKLSASNEYGQPLSLHKGKTQENLQYNSHFPKTQTVQREDTPLNVLQYDFNTQRGLLNHRTYSFYNQKEEFAYDTTDRLTRWNNAIHQYDERGRITENSAMGTYEYAQHSYQQQKLTTNEAGETYLEKYPLPTVRYNAFKAPEQIYVKDKERISYEYNAFGERSHCYYGNAEVEKAKRPMLKHYSHDGSTEIVCNKTDNSTKFVFYLGGDAYSAPAILISDGEAQKLYYLHRDYLGSIVMLTDEDGNIAERRHFDPWGQPIKIEDGAGKVLQGLTLLDRGFTGHEHLQTVGLIHMNGRLYDPALHRFLQPDNFVQDPFNTQNFNRYGYCLNNPLVYVDENGEFLWWVVGAAALIGAYTGGTIANNGEANPIKWNYSDNWGYILGGAAIGALSAYVGGSVASAIGLGSLSSNGALLGASIGGGGISGAGFSAMGGNNIFKGFLNGMVSGFVGGAIGSYIGGFGGAFMGGMSGSFTNSLLYGENFENALYSGIMGGIISYGLYNIQMRNSYNQYKKGGGEWSYKQYRKISVASQRSFAREKEFGGWITNDDVLIDPSSGRGKDFHKPSAKPNNAIGRFHTHPNSVKADYIESHSPSDFAVASVQNVTSYVIGRENIFVFEMWKSRLGIYTSTNTGLPIFRYPFYNTLWLSK